MIICKIEDYSFEWLPEDIIVVTYNDGHEISLAKVVPVNIGIQFEDNLWVVSLITKDSISKVKLGLTDNLEILGFKFKSLDNAMIVHNFLCKHILDPEQRQRQN